MIRDVKGYLTYNYKGEPSGGLLVDKDTHKIIVGFADIDHQRYIVVPLSNTEEEYESWTANTLDYVLFVNNNFTLEFAEKAIAEAQIQYSKP